MPKLKMILTRNEIKRAVDMYQKTPEGLFVARCSREILEPVMERINKKFKIENDPDHLAHALEKIIEEKLSLVDPVRIVAATRNHTLH